MNISVALASYNGEKYIKEQILSIVKQLKEEDELIISDDGSIDKTKDIILNLMKNYKQIKFYDGPKQGFKENFLYAISKCNNEIIFLSDQDDIWEKDKVKKVIEIFEKNKSTKVVMHNMCFFEDNKIIKKNIIKYKKGFFNNLLKSNYWGCAMAFRKDLKEEIMKMPKNVKAHDQWIGLLSEKNGSTFFLNEDLIKHRIHDSNQTGALNLLEKILFRANMSCQYFYRYLQRENFNVLPELMLLLFCIIPFSTMHLYIIYFFCFFIYVIQAFIRQPKNLKFKNNLFNIFCIILLLCWGYGVILGFIRGNQLSYIVRNFAGMTLYSFFIVLNIWKPNKKKIIKRLFTYSICVVILTIFTWLFIIKYPINFIASFPLLCDYAGNGTNILYGNQVIIYISTGISLYYVLTKSNIFRNLIIYLLSFIATFICIKQGGFQLAFIAITAITLLLWIKERITLFSKRPILFICIILALIVIISFISYETKGIVYKIFDPNDSGNSIRIEQIFLAAEDFSFFGKGLGASFSNGLIRSTEFNYGMEVSYVNVIHKFGIFSILIFLSYIATYWKAYFITKKDNLIAIFSIASIAFLYPSLSNPYLFHPLCVILHVIALYVLFDLNEKRRKVE
ncbi:glycosyltransferase [Traorella massiliensis]|uniref:glycosyltransferase n=1 Tax=Traorella massiliensis TaxID=1903263 RepID=UPI0008F85EB6|nr:glycosyltransferase [Traorella massiliensis]